MVCYFFMQRSLQISSMMQLVKLAPQSLGSLAGATEDQDVTLIQELGNCSSCLIGGHICHNMLCEMVLEHPDMLATLGGLFSSRVVSMLVKSMCKRSIGVVATIGC